MTFYSHSKVRNGKAEGSKLLQVHTQGVLEKALAQLYPKVNFGIPFESLKNVLETVAKFHDLGKYTSYFQNYLLLQQPINQTLKQHARFGGYAAYQFQKENKQEDKLSILTLYLIFLHHSKLIDLDELPSKIDFDAQNVFETQLSDIKTKIPEIEKELSINNLDSILQFPNEKELRKSVRYWVVKNTDIKDYFLINYLFSLLIEADKLDASDTRIYNRLALDADLVDIRFGLPKPDLLGLTDIKGLNNNELRNYSRAQVVSHLQDKNILEQRIFTITAPTGIGKTMIALDFALKLKAKISAKENIEVQIIYALPFINIIEQALGEYKKTLPDQANILGHYQFADIFGQQDSSDEINYNQKLMELDTWQCDIVITSFVQFFETLIGNRNKLLKKFNHYAGSIIILDEVQTLRLDQMPLIGAALFYLSTFLNARIILMTATKPKIFELAEVEILYAENQKVNALELLTDHDQIFSLFQRTSIRPLLNRMLAEKDERSAEFIETIFTEKWTAAKSCIIVCNTVKRSIDLCNKVSEYLKLHHYNNRVFYLSTNIIPSHRMERIERIRNSIENKEAPILIATQVVEAGVDLDFDMGFRDVGPIDSIIQVAGRINRNNNPSKTNAPLYIIDFNECGKIYGRMTYEQALKALGTKMEIPEREYLQLTATYFDNISDRSSFFDAREFFKSMKMLKYDSSQPKKDHAISAFKIIEESDQYQSVFIEIDQRAKNVRQKYLQKIKGEINKETFEKDFKLDFQQHIISIPKSIASDLGSINEYEENILFVPFEDLANHYDLATGFIRNKKPTALVML